MQRLGEAWWRLGKIDGKTVPEYFGKSAGNQNVLNKQTILNAV